MSVKAGELIHVGNSILIDRAQTGGVSSLNQPTDKVYELGNYESVGTIRDTPDLQFGLESFDTSAALEALLQNVDNTAAADQTIYDISKSLYIDVLGQFKKGRNALPAPNAPYQVAGSVVVPYLALSNLSYRFGMHDNASETATLNGDSIFYAEASAYRQVATGSGAASQTILLAQPAIPYKGDTTSGPRYALSVQLVNSGQRLSYGVDYTEAHTGSDPSAVVTLTMLKTIPSTDKIAVVYQSKATVASYPQASHTAAQATKPAAIRGKDIVILLGEQGTPLDPDANKLTGVQSFGATWQVNLEKDEEFGNAQAIAQDYDVPDVNGTVNFKPLNFADFMRKIRLLAGLSPTADESVGPYQVVPLQMAAILHSPYDGSVLKTLYVPDARFTLPTGQGRVQSKWAMDLAYVSDGGILQVSKGLYPFA